MKKVKIISPIGVEYAELGIVVLDKYEIIWQKQSDGEGGYTWYSIGDSQEYSWFEVAEGLPLEVLYGKVKKSRVYKEVEENNFPVDFIWKCWTPEYGIIMQFPSWEKAMEVALMPPEDRKAMISEEMSKSNFS